MKLQLGSAVVAIAAIVVVSACEARQPLVSESAPVLSYSPDSTAQHVVVKNGMRVRWFDGYFTVDSAGAGFEYTLNACTTRDTTVNTPYRLYDTRFDFYIDSRMYILSDTLEAAIGRMAIFAPQSWNVPKKQVAVLRGMSKSYTLPITAYLDSLTNTGWVKVDHHTGTLRYRVIEPRIFFDACHGQGGGSSSG